MIDDFRPAAAKPKTIDPLPKGDRPSIHELAAREAPGFSTREPDTAEQAAPEPTFRTPDEAAAGETADEPATNNSAANAETATNTPDTLHSSGVAAGHFGKPPKHRWYRHLWPRGKKQRIIASVVVVLVFFGIGAAWAHFAHTTKPVQAEVVKQQPKQQPPKPTTVPSTLTGLPVDPSVNKRPVTAVMVENSPDARPQSGLDQAGVVFEALAEGGVTRFMALYQDTQPDYIGPVRSARPYFISWALGFDAAYAHVGGSPQGLQDIKNWGVKDLDQFSNSSAYERISTRYAPHNVYTSIAQLSAIEQKRGYTTSTFTGFARKPDSPSKTPNATSINMTFSGYYYNTGYTYDAATNSYKRSEEGQPHMELSKTGQQTQITPKVVVAMVVPWSQGSLDTSGAFYSDYATIGSGTVYVFQDGTVETGTWSKTSNTAPLTFTDASGKPLQLNAGQTWVAAIASTGDVTYK
ncbi:MAG TPA: DUF3048 domain-containing protein [Candidatus Saccharimonadales bacterium]